MSSPITSSPRIILACLMFVIGVAIGAYYLPTTGAPAAKPIVKGWHCPMHPDYKSDKPGKCGICGMDLVPDGEPTSAGATHDHDHDHDHAPGTVHVSADKQQLIGVRSSEVTLARTTAAFRATGKVTLDETRIARVQSRIDGWIDKVYIDFTGKLVEKGQPLLTLYSPEMLSSQQEYLLALRGREIMSQSTLASARSHSESLIAAARKRLELWDLSESQIDEITRTRKPIEKITIFAPTSGYVTERKAFPKQRITPDTELYTVADLSRVWVMADVFESDAALVRTGMPVSISLPYAPGRKLTGRVDYIQPSLDATSRSLKARIEVANPNLLLKPEMFVDVDFASTLPSRLTVPADAVLNSGLRQTVFVDLGDGYFEPREVEVGERSGDRIEILKGLKAGDRVVTSGNFLIDSESRLKHD